MDATQASPRVAGLLDRPRRFFRNRGAAAWLPVTLAIAVVSWDLAVRIFEPPHYLVPPPHEVVVAFGRLISSGLLFDHGLITLTETFAGFGCGFVAALVVGTLVAESRTFENIAYPYFAALQSMPKVAIAPLIMIWFGMGMESKIVLAGLLAFFPMLVNTVEGLKSVDEKRVRLLQALDASRLQTLWLLKIPNALPFILAGIELGLIYAMLGAIVAEFVGSSAGLGAYLMAMNYQMDTSGSFALLVILAGYGAVVQVVLRAVRRRYLFWARSQNRSTAP